MKTYTLKVVEIKSETEDTVSLCFKQPALRKIRYRAGQYITLIFRINGRRFVRPYSFSSSPSVDEMLEVTVKRINNGVVSNHIHDRVKVGDVIEVMEPLGDFVLNDRDGEFTTCFWGAGSGITPLYSMIKEILHTNSSSLVYLVYGNKDYESTIFRDNLHDLASVFEHRLKVVYVHTRPSFSSTNHLAVEGRINEDFVKNVIIKNSLENSTHYICGPAGLKESVKKALDFFSVSSSQVFTEEFELVKDPKDLEDLLTRNITLKFRDVDYSLEIIKGHNILETGLNIGIELPYSCQTGACSTCKATLISGRVKMIGLIKERSDLKSNEYLLCCSYPLSDNACLEVI